MYRLPDVGATGRIQMDKWKVIPTMLMNINRENILYDGDQRGYRGKFLYE